MGKVDRFTIGICGIADFRSNMGQSVIKGLNDAAERLDVNIINFCGAVKYSISDDYSLYSYYPKVFRYLNDFNIDGLVSWASSLHTFLDRDKIDRLHTALAPLPIVGVGTHFMPGIPAVYTNNSESLGLVMDHLILDRGCRRIAFLGTTGRPFYQDRLAGYYERLKKHQIPVDESLVFITEHFDAGEFAQCVEQIIDAGAHKPPLGIDGLVTVSDIVAEQAVGILVNRGIRVPEDIAVTGFNNQIHSRTAMVPLTTVDPNFYQKSHRAMELVLELIRNPGRVGNTRSESFPATLVVRQSTGVFEDIIMNMDAGGGSVSGRTYEGNLAASLERHLLPSSPAVMHNTLPDLCEALQADLDGDGLHLLTYIRKNFETYSIVSEDYNNSWQNMISTIREIILSKQDLTGRQQSRMENIFHQARALISIFDSYFLISENHDAYKFNHISQIAIDFSFAEDGKQIMQMLGKHVEDLGIPGVVLVLQDEMHPDVGDGKVALRYPAKPFYRRTDNEETWRISAGRLPIRELLPESGRAFRYVMKILYHKGQFMGTLLMEYGPLNVAMYDLLCVLLSRALYSNYLKMNRVNRPGDIQALIRKMKLESVLESETQVSSRTGLTVDAILEYLAKNVGTKTNVPRMASDLGVSESGLMKKTKNFTGQSVQSLHEKMKVERAKILLAGKDLSIADVSEKLGFTNQSYFARIFKKHTGLSPRSWARTDHAPDGFI